jgi:hypothetical protein
LIFKVKRKHLADTGRNSVDPPIKITAGAIFGEIARGPSLVPRIGFPINFTQVTEVEMVRVPGSGAEDGRARKHFGILRQKKPSYSYYLLW